MESDLGTVKKALSGGHFIQLIQIYSRKGSNLIEFAKLYMKDLLKGHALLCCLSIF